MLDAIDKQSFGVNGIEFLAPTADSTQNAFCALQFVTAGTLAALDTDSVHFGEDWLVNQEFPAGFVLYLPFTYVNAGTATVIAYRASQ